MLLGVMSDSHDNMPNVERAAEIFNREGVELVIHLGDVVAPFIVKRLAERLKAGVIMVYGNNDGEKRLLRAVAEEAGYEIHEPPVVVDVAGRRLLLAHGFGSKENTLAIVEALASSGRFDAVLYGHTHQADHRRLGDTLLLNPGETYGHLHGEPSIAILDTEDMKPQILAIPWSRQREP